MADQTIRGKCQNLFGTDRATVRIYAERRRAERLRLSKICRAAGATWNTLIGAASFAGFKSTRAFRSRRLFQCSMILSENRIPLFRIMLSFQRSMILSENRIPLFRIML